MTTVHVRYRYEPEGWWAESEDVEGWTALGATFNEVRSMARSGIVEFLGNEVLIQEEGIPLELATGVWPPAGTNATYVLSKGEFLKVSTSVIPARTDRQIDAVADLERAG